MKTNFLREASYRRKTNQLNYSKWRCARQRSPCADPRKNLSLLHAAATWQIPHRNIRPRRLYGFCYTLHSDLNYGAKFRLVLLLLRPVYSDTTQRRVELSCVAINGPLDAS